MDPFLRPNLRRFQYPVLILAALLSGCGPDQKKIDAAKLYYEGAKQSGDLSSMSLGASTLIYHKIDVDYYRSELERVEYGIKQVITIKEFNQKGRYDEALALAAEHLTEFPNNVEVQTLQSEIQSKVKRNPDTESPDPPNDSEQEAAETTNQ